MEPFVRLGGVVALLALGGVVMRAGGGPNIGAVVGTHGWLLVAVGTVWLLWKPAALAAKILAGSFFAGLGLRGSGVFRRDKDR